MRASIIPPALLQFDLPYYKTLINSRMQPADFGSCYLVQLYQVIAKEKGISDKALEALTAKFNTALWKNFLRFAHDPFLQGRDRGDFQDYEMREAARASEIRQSVSACTARWYRQLHGQWEKMMAFHFSSRYHFAWANDLVLSEIAEKAPEEGLKALRYYAKKSQAFGGFPEQVLQVFFKAGREWTQKAWAVVDKCTFPRKAKWTDRFFYRLPAAFIDRRMVNRLLKSGRATVSGDWLSEATLDKFEPVEPRIYQRMLQVLYDRRQADSTFVFRLGYQFFRNFAGKKVSIELCKAVYFQQEQMPGHFDSDGAEFFAIFDLDPGFLIEYTRYVTTASPMRFSTDYRPLGRIWDDPMAEKGVSAVCEELAVFGKQYFSREMLASLFFNVKPEHHHRAVSFLAKVIRTYNDNDRMIDAVFEIARTRFKTHYMELIVTYLRQNPDVEQFKKKELLDTSFFTSSNEIWEEVRAIELQAIREQLANELDWLSYQEHLDFIAQWIRAEQERARHTRKKRFRKLEF